MAVHKGKPLTSEEYKDLSRWAGAAENLEELRHVVQRLLEAVGYDAEIAMSTGKMDDAT